MWNTYEDANRYSVNGERPVALGNSQWRPGGYQQQGTQWVRPPEAGVYRDAMAAELDRTNPGEPAPMASEGSPKETTDTRWNANAKRQMDAVGQKYGRTWRDDEYDQWLGPSGYINKNDIDGQGRTLAAYSGEGDIDPYWLSRMGMHATGDYYGNGTTPMDANSSRVGGANQAMAAAGASAIDPLLSGDPLARIQQALAKLSGHGVNLDALIAQLGGGA